MASFYVVRGRDNGQHFAVRGASATIGRESANQIQLHDSEVSRRHARIVRTGPSNFEIVDNQSSNGTFVNGNRVESQVLRSGDRVQVGRTLMIFTGGPDLQSTRSIDAVEIVSPGQAGELSQIRSSIDSQLAVASDVSAQFTAESERDQTPANEKAVGETLSKAKSNLEVVYQVGQAIHRTGDLSELLNQLLELIFHWIECDRGCILMNDDITGQLSPIASLDRKNRSDDSPRPKRPLAISRTILDYVCRTKEGVLTSNAQDDERWSNAESVSELGIHEAICVPMQGRYGFVGVIYIDTSISPGKLAQLESQQCFDKEHLMLMMAIGGQAALAIEDTQFYRAMVQSERLAAMGQTIANLSHHVKNILQGVSGANYLVEQGIKNGDVPLIKQGWEMVQRNQERISNLVLDMLSYSKQREPELTAGDLCPLIKEVMDMVSPSANAAGVELQWRQPDMPIMASFDAEAIHRALLNVVSNAVDATSQTAGGKVTVEATTADASVEIRVKDNGPGISEEDAARIFAPFESSKGTRGTGLGLPVSQKIMREHGGDLSLVSKPGEETCFLLHWPTETDVENRATGGG